ncbi:Aminopeptidase N [Marinovum algicola]|uniref:Aminopeptidase N n=1 Tax=Marinovum algicola TaxID=42444 RepID=A0A975WBG9_9RHOB|nr:M1 family metallopeptidase [Marinovum algicola]SEJ76305.1 aminopeptidase N [Marinovum algicola]SLN60595.1 Aminopeptidase N [Marinovum algicola]
MKDASPQTIYLKDYTPFGFTVESVELTFRLAPHATRVLSKIRFAPNPEATDRTFFLHGEDLRLISARIDGREVNPELSDRGLTCAVPERAFTWEAEVEIDPANNTALEGLYMSSGMYCTQCEAEGFRKITFYPDRPDVMSVFTVRIEGDLPVMLSNGNKAGQGAGWAEWHDPWPKPAYLFALVAGDLVNHPDSFTTGSGRAVELNIWVRPGDLHKCAFGMEALKRSMTWDEEVYGREYDLDIFNIVAVDDFNMGAMENNGLNIFNSSAVLASPETATDANFERIEAIIAHEYFHNWTGNRITCRDWFQLCLKEGLTVFRDAQFTSDVRSAPVKRIGDVMDLRGRQFPEDNGPLSHPVRPESFQEINNFYTATVYEKGAEVIGMLKRLVGEEAYYKAVELYFERHDGDAATIEDWLKVFEDTTGRDLGQFKRWYSQSGTPRLTVEEAWEPGETGAEGVPASRPPSRDLAAEQGASDDSKGSQGAPDQVRGAAREQASGGAAPTGGGTYTLTFRQETRPTPGQEEKLPQVIPIAVGLLGPNGAEVRPTEVLEMTQAEQSFRFTGLATKPVPSILRDFSAPVVLDRSLTSTENAFLLAHDTDPFNRWEAGRNLARATLLDMATGDARPDGDYLDGLTAVLRDRGLDPALRAQMLALPTQSEIAQMQHDRGQTPDPEAIYTAHETLKLRMAEHLQDLLPVLYAENQIEAPYRPDADQASKRDLSTAVLGLLSRIDGGAQAAQQYARADNMTLQLSALAGLLIAGKGEAELEAFQQQWKDDRLVMDKWFGLQVSHAAPARAAEVAERLTRHPDFTLTNPNRFRAVLGALGMNHAGFHHGSGKGYALVADKLIALDAKNPQTTARMCALFQTWRRYDASRQAHARAALERIAATPGLSRDTTEMVTRMLAGA